ncbi:hypothetical protein DWG24_09710 [Dickeya zeae]|uniref:Uncharacterized protein n=1 Tax=Dickeya zeae TaxID=204042 RepID=A0AAE6YYN0_9GAMM|nr:hypothetical protein DWG24_09710 [Dickeya zeae]
MAQWAVSDNRIGGGRVDASTGLSPFDRVITFGFNGGENSIKQLENAVLSSGATPDADRNLDR